MVRQVDKAVCALADSVCMIQDGGLPRGPFLFTEPDRAYDAGPNAVAFQHSAHLLAPLLIGALRRGRRCRLPGFRLSCHGP